MRLLIPLDGLDQYGCRDPIPLECEVCGSEYHRPKNYVQRVLRGTRTSTCCSKQCVDQKRKAPIKKVNCLHCQKEFERPNTKRAATYCSRKCASNGSRTEEMRQQFLRNRKPNSRKTATIIKYANCTNCKKLFVTPKWSNQRCCSAECRTERNSERCKATVGMCKNNNRHAGWYESPIAGRIWLESSWEVQCAEILDRHKIEWTRPKTGFKWLDVLGRSHTYYPDFYLPQQNIYLDPKNPFAQARDAYKISDVRTRHHITIHILSKNDIEEDKFLELVLPKKSGPSQ